MQPAILNRTAQPQPAGISRQRLRVLSISSVFPNTRDPGHGVFVRSRLQALSAGADITVIAPVPLIDYSKGIGAMPAGIPKVTVDGSLRVLHPLWLYPPLGSAINVPLLFLRLLGPVSKIVEAESIDVIDAHFGYPEGVAAAMLAAITGVPFVVTLRGNETMHAKYTLRRRLMSWMLRRADLVIAVSDRLRNFAISLGTEPKRAVTIPNGVDTSVFYPRDRQEVRRKLGLHSHTRIILSAGSLIERKGHHCVVAILNRLTARGEKVRLLIAGGAGREGHYEDQLREQTIHLGLQDRVQFLGHVKGPAMAELMSAADVLCLASSREGWPNVVHEALACGTPVVATDVGAIPDMLASDRLGAIVPVNNPDRLAQALQAALDRRWDHEAIAEFGQLRCWSQVADEVLKAMETIARNGGGK
jgi:teichuronic acid biosynthesis glycosyltransferase TuaC